METIKMANKVFNLRMRKEDIYHEAVQRRDRARYIVCRVSDGAEDKKLGSFCYPSEISELEKVLAQIGGINPEDKFVSQLISDDNNWFDDDCEIVFSALTPEVLSNYERELRAKNTQYEEKILKQYSEVLRIAKKYSLLEAEHGK